MHQHHRLNGVIAVALIALSGASHAQEAFAAKSLFFGEDGDVKAVATTPANPELARSEGKPVVVATSPKAPARPRTAARADPKALPAGMSYFVRLRKPDGSSEDTLTTRSFATGEKFQLGLKVNRPSHVYIFNEDPEGRITMLHPQQGQTAAVDAMGTVFLPARGAFEFQGPPGLEKLLVLMSDEEVFQPKAALQRLQPDLVTRTAFATVPAAATAPARSVPALPAGGCQVASADTGGFASKAIVYAQDPGDTAAACAADPDAPPAFASKAIVFADDPRPAAGQQVASYVVKPQALEKKEPLLIKVQLTHR